jgi:nucleoside phosphorylase
MSDFTELQSAAKANKRSHKFNILCALYDLRAHLNPVTTTQVNELLDLHLKKKKPVNPNASLNAYKGFVAPVMGKPRRWTLTKRGIDFLETTTNLKLGASKDSSFESDIGIICALEDPELSAVQEALGGASSWKTTGHSGFTHIYRETQLVTLKGSNLRIVATASTSMGLTAATIATTQLIMQFRPRLIVMIGIAAGTKSGGKKFGDVLVADPSVDYSSGKVVSKNGSRVFEPDSYPIGISPRHRIVLKKFQSEKVVFEEIRKKWTDLTPEGPNRMHLGALGSADQVIDNRSMILEIEGHWRKLIGVEMETYGVYRATFEAPEPKPRVLSFKSVCDFAEGKKDTWQNYAAFVAAEFAVRFFINEWEALWPPS